MLASLRTAELIANEVNQDIVMHMAEHMGINMKEIINSVTRNRYVFCFHLCFVSRVIPHAARVGRSPSDLLAKFA